MHNSKKYEFPSPLGLLDDLKYNNQLIIWEDLFIKYVGNSE
jgi:hypothetical protein